MQLQRQRVSKLAVDATRHRRGVSFSVFSAAGKLPSYKQDKQRAETATWPRVAQLTPRLSVPGYAVRLQSRSFI